MSERKPDRKKHDTTQEDKVLAGGPGKSPRKGHLDPHYSGNKEGQKAAEPERADDEPAEQADEHRNTRLHPYRSRG